MQHDGFRTSLAHKARKSLVALIDAQGEAEAARLLRVHRQTLARGAAGLKLNGSTAAIMTVRLAELADEMVLSGASE